MASFALVQQAARTTTGTQDFTVSGFGTPVGAIFWGSYGTANGTSVAHGGLFVGATDGTRDRSIGFGSENGQATTDTGGQANVSNCIVIPTSTVQTTIVGAAAFSAWITDGVRINWGTAPGTAYLVNCLLIGGSGVSGVYVNNSAPGATLDTATTISSVGFTSDVILVFGGLDGASGNLTHTSPSIGVYVRDGSDTQASYSYFDTSATGTSTLIEIIDTTSVARRAVSGAGGAEAQIQNVGASGFDLYRRVNGSGALEVMYVCIDLNGLSAKLITQSTPTSTGAQAITGVGFTPELLLALSGSALANNTVYTDGNAESLALGMATATDAFVSGLSSDDGVSPSVTESRTNNRPVSVIKDAGVLVSATLTSFDTDGATLNYSTVDASARQQIMLFVGSVTSRSLLMGGKLIGKLERG